MEFLQQVDETDLHDVFLCCWELFSPSSCRNKPMQKENATKSPCILFHWNAQHACVFSFYLPPFFSESYRKRHRWRVCVGRANNQSSQVANTQIHTRALVGIAWMRPAYRCPSLFSLTGVWQSQRVKVVEEENTKSDFQLMNEGFHLGEPLNIWIWMSGICF